MLLILLFWGWALGVSLGLGLGLTAALRRLAGPLPNVLSSSPELLCLTGLAALAWLVAVLSFCLPVALPMQVGVSALAAGGLLANWLFLKELFQKYAREWRVAGIGAGALAAVLAALVLVHAAQPPVFPDAALYHAQFVQWLHHYPVVPGLGNLQSRLAFNSHAHLLTAFFSPATGRGPAFQQLVNSLGCLLLVLHHVRRAATHARPGGQPWLSWFYLGTLLFLLMAVRPWISSPLPDSTVAVWGLLLLGALLETPRLALGGLAWLTLLTATALTFKPSAGMLLLWPAAALLRLPRRTWRRGLAVVVGVAAVAVLPWLGRNTVLSGYVAYPLVGWSVGLDWTVPEPQRLADLAEIQLFARRPLSDWPEAAGQPLAQWLPLWWAQQEPADKRLLAFGLVGVALVLGWLIWLALRQPAALRRQLGRAEVQLYALLLAGCGGWFVAAPALRFAYAYLIGAAVLGPLLLLRASLARWGQLSGRVLLALGLLYGANGLRHELDRPGALTTYITWPADYPPMPVRIAGWMGPYPLRVALPPTERCGNCPLPCAEAWRPGLRLRGTTLGEGFRTQVAQPAPVFARP
ncbi:MAG: hypothetical protein EOO59_02390 [Hymenobacter sp.]|nr:MAG: hypothetical protein EOO59_02390 [Hymenobacter sp.]